MINIENLICKRGLGMIMYTDSRRSIIDQLSEEDNIEIGTQYKSDYLMNHYGITTNQYYNICINGDINYSPICACPKCENVVKFRTLSVGYYKYCCKSCTMIGKTMPVEQIEKMRKTKTGVSLTPEHRAAIVKGRIGIRHSESAKENMRKARINIINGPWTDKHYEGHKNFGESGGVFGIMYANPEKYDISKLGQNSRFKSGVFSSLKSNRCYYRSSYELKLMEILEEDSSVVSFFMEPFLIPYVGLDKKNHKYIPDCLIKYVNNVNVLVEVKPERLLNTPTNILKFEAGKEYCKNNNMEYVIWTEKELFINKKNVIR